MHLGGLVMELTKYKLGKLIEQCDNRNTDEEYTADDVRGISTGKEFIETKANMDGVSLTSYKIVKENEFAYVADTSRRGEKIAVAFNRNEGNILISSIYTVFYVSNPELPTIYLCFLIVLNLIVIHDLILGGLQEKLLVGKICVI